MFDKLNQPKGSTIGVLRDGRTIQEAFDDIGINVKAFGAMGDGVTDDSTAIRNALSSLQTGGSLYFPSGTYKVSSPISVDFNGKERIVIHMEGHITPDEGVINAMTLKNLSYSSLTLNVYNGGKVVSNLADVDYSQPDPAGCRQAFVLDSLRAVKVKITGRNYKGRVLRTLSTGATKFSFVNLDLRTGDTWGQCYQACYLQGADSAWGVISSAQTQWDVYGSVLDGITDVTVTYWEYGASVANYNPALTLNKLSSAHIGVLAGGQGAGTGTALKINEGVAISIDKLFTTECSVGLHIVGRTQTGSSEVNKQLTIGCHYSYGSNSKSLVLDGARNVSIKDVHYDSVGDYGVELVGTVRDVDIAGYIRNPRVNCVKSAIGSNVSRLTLRCRLYSASNVDLLDFMSGTIGNIFLDGCTATTAGGTVANLQAANGVRVIGGEFGTTGASLWNNRPAYISGTATPKVVGRGSSNVPNGSIDGTDITVPHGLGVAPTVVTWVWVDKPRPGSTLQIKSIDATNITFTLCSDGAFAAQVNFRWQANGEYA